MTGSWLLALLLLQAPGDGWALVQAPPRDVRRVYWDLFETSEVWVRLVPEDPGGKPPLVNLVFQAFFPGRAERDIYSGLPTEPKGPPARLTVRAQPLSIAVTRELALSFLVDGRTIDLTGPDRRHRYIPCPVALGDCSPNAVEADLDPAVLEALTRAARADGQALGFPIRLTPADQLALTEFVAHIGLRAERK